MRLEDSILELPLIMPTSWPLGYRDHVGIKQTQGQEGIKSVASREQKKKQCQDGDQKRHEPGAKTKKQGQEGKCSKIIDRSFFPF